MKYLVVRLSDDLFRPWEVVGRFREWDEAYAELMWRRDEGETVKIKGADDE